MSRPRRSSRAAARRAARARRSARVAQRIVAGVAAQRTERPANGPASRVHSRARAAISCGAGLGQQLVPGIQGAELGAAGAHPPQQVVSLRPACAVLGGGGRGRRPQPGQHAVEVGPPQRRRALHQPQPVGREHQHREPRQQPLDRPLGCAVHRHALGLARPVADLRPRPARRDTSTSVSTRSNVGAEPHQPAARWWCAASSRGSRSGSSRSAPSCRRRWARPRRPGRPAARPRRGRSSGSRLPRDGHHAHTGAR